MFAPLFGKKKKKNLVAKEESLKTYRGFDKLFKKLFIFHFNQNKSSLIKRFHCKLLNPYKVTSLS